MDKEKWRISPLIVQLETSNHKRANYQVNYYISFPGKFLSIQDPVSFRRQPRVFRAAHPMHHFTMHHLIEERADMEAVNHVDRLGENQGHRLGAGRTHSNSHNLNPCPLSIGTILFKLPDKLD